MKSKIFVVIAAFLSIYASPALAGKCKMRSPICPSKLTASSPIECREGRSVMNPFNPLMSSELMETSTGENFIHLNTDTNDSEECFEYACGYALQEGISEFSVKFKTRGEKISKKFNLVRTGKGTQSCEEVGQ